MVSKIEPREATLKAGYGYWDVTVYPYGGCFKRAAADTQVTVIDEPGGKYGYKVRFADGRIGMAGYGSVSLAQVVANA